MMRMLRVINDLVLKSVKRPDVLQLWVSILFSNILLSSCKQPSSCYIISKEDSLTRVANTNADGIVLMPPKVKYAPYTFVIDSNNNIYYYCFPEEKAGGGINDGEEPNNIGLMPNHLSIIPGGSERSFFEKNVLFLKSSRPTKSIILSSFRDTIDNDFLDYLRKTSLNKSNKIFLRIRMALPEERRVIYHKINGIYYQSVR